MATFPRTVLPETAEELILRGESLAAGDELFVDLSSAKFIEPTAVVSLIAAISSLRVQVPGLRLRLELPTSRKARDFLRRWRFGSTIEHVLDISLEDDNVLTDKSRKYRLKDAATPGYYEPAQRSDEQGELHSLTSRRFFNTMVWTVPPDLVDAMRMAPVERDRWVQSEEIQALLERHLGRRSYLVAPSVIYEAILNAAMHPGASKLLVLSHLNTKASKKYPEGLLTISFWDDGDSIPSTISAAIAEGRKLRPESYEHYYEWCASYVQSEGKPKWRHVEDLFTGDDPAEYTSERQLLIASTYPGVSSNHTGIRPSRGRSERLGRDWDKTGMGLWILTTTVIDSFGGEVALRAGSRFANFKRAVGEDQVERRTRYRCNSTTSGGTYRFIGNQVTVRIPLMPESNE